MNLEDRINVLDSLGSYLDTAQDDEYQSCIRIAQQKNPWFTKENIHKALKNISSNFLKADQLTKWTEDYSIDNQHEKTLALVLAGNIPAVGFHDIVCSFIANYTTQIKLSSKDDIIIPFLIKKINELDSRTIPYFTTVERLENFDYVIATGSNNTSLYFEQYFSKYPHIIRKNRHSIGIISPDFTDQDIIDLGHDIYDYYGLGCRNVSKLFIHESIEMNTVMELLHDEYKYVLQHTKYMNNYDYNYAIYLLNKDNFLMNGGIILKEDESLHSRIATVHFERYKDDSEVISKMENESEHIQCVVSKKQWQPFNSVLPGQGQSPTLWDYADGVDVMEFLTQ